MFKEGTVSGPADIISAFTSSPHVEQVPQGFVIYKCIQSDETIYTPCASTFLFAVPFQTPYEISFAVTADLDS
jgi:hypothetical protein